MSTPAACQPTVADEECKLLQDIKNNNISEAEKHMNKLSLSAKQQEYGCDEGRKSICTATEHHLPTKKGTL